MTSYASHNREEIGIKNSQGFYDLEEKNIGNQKSSYLNT